NFAINISLEKGYCLISHGLSRTRKVPLSSNVGVNHIGFHLERSARRACSDDENESASRLPLVRSFWVSPKNRLRALSSAAVTMCSSRIAVTSAEIDFRCWRAVSRSASYRSCGMFSTYKVGIVLPLVYSSIYLGKPVFSRYRWNP